MKYDRGTGDLTNWIVSEPKFESKFQGKCEAIFCQGNGYMGVRHSTEESYIGQVRNHFVAGTFNKCADNEVTELPNAADVVGMDILINGQLLHLEHGETSDYDRSLNLQNGEVIRSFTWKDASANRYRFEFKRFVSMADLHLMSSQVSITPLDSPATIVIKSGINGQVTNTGAQHFKEGEKRIYDGSLLQMLQETNESGINFIHTTSHQTSASDVKLNSRFEMDRRKVLMIYEGEAATNQTLVLTKHSSVFTTRDKDASDKSLQELKTIAVEHLKGIKDKGYADQLGSSAKRWAELWKEMEITVSGEHDFDQLAIRFAQYHLMVMTPAHDNRMGIAAKGLSGEGYKGHSFWDSEIFVVPFFTYTYPDIARSLMEYRYKTIDGAHRKAEENGYKGAMYPWESAWADDGEVTPVWGAADIITGEATKIWSGFIEQHITSDVAFGVWQYYQVTGDEDFMERYGYEILLDTGIFWASRLEWNEEHQRYHINDVVGPDEYKEHVNNDAFTNYMARWCMENAIHYNDLLKSTSPDLYQKLDKKLNLTTEIEEVKARFDKVYIPSPNENNVIPQDDTYLTLKDIDLTKYKNQKSLGSLFLDYNLDQVNQIQVSKQASVVMLMYLLEHKFSNEVKVANYDYYEPRTLHDSSLSLSTHAVLASDVNDTTLAYNLFQRAAQIDLGPKMKTSDHGIHAASIGGIWQILVCGFGGVRMVGGKLRIQPRLPEKINEINFPINWKGNRLEVSVNHSQIAVVNKGADAVDVEILGQQHTIKDSLEVALLEESINA